MQTIKFENDIEFEKRILLCLYWTARKARVSEGCAPFYIKKIVTPNNTHISSSQKLLKLSSDLVFDIQRDMEYLNYLELEMHIGEEKLTANFEKEKISISASKNKELEAEITNEIYQQSQRKYPRTCPQFSKRVYKGYKK